MNALRNWSQSKQSSCIWTFLAKYEYLLFSCEQLSISFYTIRTVQWLNSRISRDTFLSCKDTFGIKFIQFVPETIEVLVCVIFSLGPLIEWLILTSVIRPDGTYIIPPESRLMSDSHVDTPTDYVCVSHVTKIRIGSVLPAWPLHHTPASLNRLDICQESWYMWSW